MLRLDLTLDDPALNLAFDEALLDEAESGRLGDLLRLWQFCQTVVVLGRSSKYHNEIQSTNCRHAGVPVLRRSSGGGAIVAGPGCLLYSLILSFERHPELRAINVLHQWVMERIVRALRPLAGEIGWQGVCDVTIGGWKISGNSVRIGRSAALYHGTVLCSMDLASVDSLLGVAIRQPAYREGRPHQSFMANLAISPVEAAEAIAVEFDANVPQIEIPLSQAEQLAANRYRDPAWTTRH